MQNSFVLLSLEIFCKHEVFWHINMWKIIHNMITRLLLEVKSFHLVMNLALVFSSSHLQIL